MPGPAPPTVPWIRDEFRIGSEFLADTRVTYNGYAFPPATEVKVQIEPVYESSGRVPKWWKHTLTVEFVIVPQTAPQANALGGDNVDVNTETAKRLLLIPGAPLTFSLQGLGAATRDTAAEVYTVTADKDLDFGPKPMLLNWEPIGANRAVRVQWSVTFSLSVCCYSDSNNPVDGICDNPPDMSWSLNSVRFTEFNYSLSFGVNEEGFVTKTVVGSAEVQGLLVRTTAGVGLDGLPLPTGQLAMPDMARYVPLEIVQNRITSLFPPVPGFLRSFQWDVSRDGRRVDWRITDSEAPTDNPYLPGMMKIRARHSMKARMPFFIWDNTISGSFTVMPNTPKFLAWSAFLLIVKARWASLKLAAAEMLDEFSSTGTTATVPVSPCFIPWNLSIEEDLFSRTCSFSLDYKVFCSFQTVFAASGMFQPIGPRVGADWTQWRLSLPDAVRSGRGGSNLSAGGPGQTLVVACTEGTSPTNNSLQGEKTGPLPDTALFYSRCPPPEKSWADYKIWFEIRAESNSVEHQKAYGPPESLYSELGSIAAGAARYSTFPPTLPSAVRDDYQTQPTDRNVNQGLSTYSWLIIMHGYAYRLCYDVPLPELMYVGGVKPFHVRDVVHAHRKRISDSGPVPLFLFAWSRYYRVTTPPSGSMTVNNSFTGNPSDLLGGPPRVEGEQIINSIQ